MFDFDETNNVSDYGIEFLKFFKSIRILDTELKIEKTYKKRGGWNHEIIKKTPFTSDIEYTLIVTE